MRRDKNFWAAILIGGLVGGGMLGPTAWAGPPTEAVRKSVDEVIRILEDPAWKKPEKKEERRKLLEQTIAQRFNFQEMARRTLGAEWAKRTPEEQKEFAGSFQTLLANTYLGRIENYTGEKVQYLKEMTDGEYAEVQTKIDNGKTAIDITYKLESVSGDWRVYDVIAEGTSLVQNYREQFKRILSKQSFAELSSQLRKKSESIKSPGSGSADSARSR
ncbi:MAG TPA: ABC transporter substrate-binding protein [Nitrospirales bacterium]|nr:ABC transporter substrate-binding protein [Nitrospirales bacterium]